MTLDTTPSWDFAPIYDLLDSFKQSYNLSSGPAECQSSSTPSSPPLRIPSPSEFDPKVDLPQNLGDFNRLYHFLGLPIQEFPPGPRRDSIEHGTASDPDTISEESAGSTPPSSLPDTIIHGDVADTRKVRWTDELEVKDSVKVRRRSRSRNHRVCPKISRIKNSADFDSETEPETFRRNNYNLVPSWVTPQPKLWRSPISRTHHDPTIIQPIYTLTAEEKRAKLLKKLKKRVGNGPKLMATAGDIDDSLHIFVDCSNITIGFYNSTYITYHYG